jgi:hypothetical protein
MDPRIHVITLAVLDLDRALEFYRDGLGLDTRGVVATEFTGDESTPAGAIAIFELADGCSWRCIPERSWRRMRTSRSSRRQRAGLASATSLVPKLTSTPCSSAHKRPARR